MISRVILVGPDFHHYLNSIKKALEYNGIEVFEKSYIEPIGPKTLLNRLLLKVFGQRYKEYRLRKFNDELINLFDREAPDAIFIVKGNTIKRDTLIRFGGAKKILWAMDAISNIPETQSTIDLYDHVFTFEKSEVDLLKEHAPNGISYLPLAVDETVFFKQIDVEKDIDLLFVGTLYYERYYFFKELFDRYPDLKVRIIGPLDNYTTLLKIFLKEGRIDKRFEFRNVTSVELCELYNRSKIVLNMHHRQSVYGINPRFFEIIACGAFQIVDKKPFIEDHFGAFKILEFADKKDLYAKMELAYKDDLWTYDQERLRLYVLSSHTFSCRINEILKFCS